MGKMKGATTAIAVVAPFCFFCSLRGDLIGFSKDYSALPALPSTLIILCL